MSFDVVVVCDGLRMSLGAALNILVSKRTCPEARFHAAVPSDSSIGDPLAEDIIKRFSESIFSIAAPTRVLENKIYRIENKVAALQHFSDSPCVLLDSDVLFIRPFPAEYSFRNVITAVPEHGKHVFPWDRLFSGLNLAPPDITIRLGSGEESAPWFNAGMVVCPQAKQAGIVWKVMMEYVNQCDYVPEKFPYLDQISLPLAMALLSNSRTVDYSNVLDSALNQNLFYWAGDQSYVLNGIVIHHHNRVGLIERYCSDILTWTRELHPEVNEIIKRMRAFDDTGKND